MNFLLKLLGLLFVGILSIFGFGGFLIWLALKSETIKDVLMEGTIAVVDDFLYPDGHSTHKKYSPLKPTK